MIDPGVTVVVGDRLTAAELYEVWRLRDLVFAVEQRVDDVDVDGLDLLPTTSHLWLAEDGRLTSYLRVLTDGGAVRIGRVCTRRDARGQGQSGRLMRAALDRWGRGEVRLGAQAYLERWYAGFGFTVSGPPYVEAGIDHVPMLRPGAPVD